MNIHAYMHYISPSQYIPLSCLSWHCHAHTASAELQSTERCNSPVRPKNSVSHSWKRTQSTEETAEEDLPTFHSILTVDTAERMSRSARLSRLSNPETAVEESGLLREADAADVVNQRPSTVLKTAENQFMEVEIYDLQSDRTDYSKFQSMNKAACAMMYAALMCFSLSLMCCKLSTAVREWYSGLLNNLKKDTMHKN